jgi:hypothetical protein
MLIIAPKLIFVIQDTNRLGTTFSEEKLLANASNLISFCRSIIDRLNETEPLLPAYVSKLNILIYLSLIIQYQIYLHSI